MAKSQGINYKFRFCILKNIFAVSIFKSHLAANMFSLYLQTFLLFLQVILMVRDIEEWYESYKTMVEKAMNKYFFLHVIYYLSPSTRRLLDWCWGMSKSTIVSI